MCEKELCVRIVEDSHSLAEMLGMMLELDGIRHVVTNENFHTLLAPECWEGVTAVLCDLDLGGPTTGEMVLDYLKSTHPWIKRVVLSAVAEISSERILNLAHITLLKPQGLESIIEALK